MVWNMGIFPWFVLFGFKIDDLIVPKVLGLENRNEWGERG